MKYKLVVFDFDGTLADSFSWFLGALNSVAGKYRFKPIEQDEINHLRGMSGRELMAHLRLPMWKLPLLTMEMRRRMSTDATTIKLFDGVDGMLERLTRQGMAVAVLTSNSKENVRRILGPRNAALVRHFECGASIFGKEAKFRKLLRRTGMAAAEVLCIGDETRDALAAAAAGLAFAGVAWGYARADVLAAHCAGGLFHSVDQLTEALCGDS